MTEENVPVNESEFYMWRAVFAMAHADGVITDCERAFMENALTINNFSDFQKDILKSDMENKQDINSFFKFITDQEDRSRFFYLARILCWSDGDFDAQEQEIITRLKKTHIEDMDFDVMLKTITLELDEDKKTALQQDARQFHTEEEQNGFFSRLLGRFAGKD